MAKKIYFSAIEAAQLLGSKVCFKETLYYEYPELDMRSVISNEGDIQEVFLATNQAQGITVSLLIDGDLEEMSKDQFDHYCEVVSCLHGVEYARAS